MIRGMDRPDIYGALVWFDEDPDDLEAMVESCAGFVDTLVALDGAYRTFPHDGRPVSDRSQYEALERACRRVGMGLVMPDGREWDSQVVKRTTAFHLVEQLARPYRDLVFVIDADERIIELDEPAVLEAMRSADVGTVDVVTTDPADGPMRMPGVQPPSSIDTPGKVYPRLFTVQREMRVGPAYHWTYTAKNRIGDRVVLKGAQTIDEPIEKAPVADLRDVLRLTNGTWDRPAKRLKQKKRYARERWRHGIDL